jgi:hypothetical protein
VTDQQEAKTLKKIVEILEALTPEEQQKVLDQVKVLLRE